MSVDGSINGGDALLRSLMACGVEHLFASPGSEWAPLWESLAKARTEGRAAPAYTSVRHEELAVSMAAGYAKASGKLPGVVLHTTVGTLHAAMALRTALHERVPMIVVAGESIGFGELPGMDPGGQWLNHLVERGGPAALAERTVKWSVTLAAPELLAVTVARACDLARAEPQGPTFVGVSMEALFAATGDRVPRRGPAPPAVGHPDGVAALARMLREARHPVFVCEDVGHRPDDVATLVRLAERVGAAVVESRSTHVLNFPRDHAQHAGFDPQEVLAEADLAVLVGIRAPWHPASRPPAAGLRIASLDSDPLHTPLPFWGYDADLLLTGAIGPTLALLLDEVEMQDLTGETMRAASERIPELTRRSATRRADVAASAQRLAQAVPLEAAWVSHELARLLPPETVIVEETITPRSIIHQHFTGVRPGGWFSGAFGGLGTGLGTALGVKAARPEALVACLIGDGAFAYDPALAALAAAQEHRLPLLIVIYDDRGYRSQQRTVPKYFPGGYAAAAPAAEGLSFDPPPDYAAFAAALGAHGEVIGRPAEIEPAVARALDIVRGGRTALLDMLLVPVARS